MKLIFIIIFVLVSSKGFAAEERLIGRTDTDSYYLWDSIAQGGFVTKYNGYWESTILVKGRQNASVRALHIQVKCVDGTIKWFDAKDFVKPPKGTLWKAVLDAICDL